MGLTISFQNTRNGGDIETVISLFRSPVMLSQENVGQTVVLSKLAGNDPQARGQELVAMLRQCPPVKEALDSVLRLASNAPTTPIYIRFSDDEVDRLPWEQLWDTHPGFLALDARWPIARVSARLQQERPRVYSSPFRIVAILSAASREGTPQLRALVEAVEAARHAGLLTSLHVITGEKAVFNAVQAYGCNYITVEWIEVTPDGVIEQITAAKPAILHLLCHGAVKVVDPGLSLATQRNFLAGSTGPGSIFLSVDDLTRALSNHESWLVVLAACDSANSRGAQSIARALVDSGAPAVIGMRRIVDLTATDKFCSHVYPGLLRIVREAVHPAVKERKLEWAPALTAGRRAATVGKNCLRDDAWSDSVLYLQDDFLHFSLPTGGGASSKHLAGLQGSLAMYERFLASFDPTTTPPDLIIAAQSKIASIRAQLDGTMP